MTDWYNVADDAAVERLVDAWPDAPTENLDTCALLLDKALEQVWAYAPESEPDDFDDLNVLPIPAEAVDRLLLPQLKQAENLWNAGRVSAAGDTGMDGFTFTPRPLDKTIRGMIRPQRGVFDVV